MFNIAKFNEIDYSHSELQGIIHLDSTFRTLEMVMLRSNSIMAYVLVGFVCLCCNLYFASPAEAGMEDILVQSIQQYQDTYLSHKQALLDSPDGDWPDARMQDYIKSSTLLIHWAAALALERNGHRHVSNGAELAAMGLLPEWPGNPLNNWEPVEVRLDYTEFEPLTAILSVCPPSEATRGQQLSFEVYMLGPEPDWPLADVNIMTENSSWAVAPFGTAYCAGIHFQNNDEILAFKHKLKEILQAISNSLSSAS